MGSSERVQVSVAGYLSLRPEVRSGVGRCSGSWLARDPETGWGCFTNLTLERPMLSVSPFTGSVLSEDLYYLRSCIELSFGWKCGV